MSSPFVVKEIHFFPHSYNSRIKRHGRHENKRKRNGSSTERGSTILIARSADNDPLLKWMSQATRHTTQRRILSRGFPVIVFAFATEGSCDGYFPFTNFQPIARDSRSSFPLLNYVLKLPSPPFFHPLFYFINWTINCSFWYFLFNFSELETLIRVVKLFIWLIDEYCDENIWDKRHKVKENHR